MRKGAQGDDPEVPAVVDRTKFQAELDALRLREKAHTREGDAIADARRRLPMVAVDGSAPLIGERGAVTLLDAFEGCSLYTSMIRVEIARGRDVDDGSPKNFLLTHSLKLVPRGTQLPWCDGKHLYFGTDDVALVLPDGSPYFYQYSGGAFHEFIPGN